MEQEHPNRKPIRLKAYDYAQNGAYFVTVCTHERKSLFWVGATIGRLPGQCQLSKTGIIAERLIHRINELYPAVTVEKYAVMPNHVHMLVVISNPGIGGRPLDAPTVSHIIQQYKGAVTKAAGFPVWQKSYYDHIIRSEQEYAEVWRYIDENPLKWREDEYNLQGIP